MLSIEILLLLLYICCERRTFLLTISVVYLGKCYRTWLHTYLLVFPMYGSFQVHKGNE